MVSGRLEHKLRGGTERRLDVVVSCTRLVERSVHALSAIVDASPAISNAPNREVTTRSESHSDSPSHGTRVTRSCLDPASVVEQGRHAACQRAHPVRRNSVNDSFHRPNVGQRSSRYCVAVGSSQAFARMSDARKRSITQITGQQRAYWKMLPQIFGFILVASLGLFQACVALNASHDKAVLFLIISASSLLMSISMLGKIIMKREVKVVQGENEFEMNINDNHQHSSGIYYLKTDGLDSTNVIKLVVNK